MRLNSLIKKSATSKFYLWLLNVGLWRVVPFNSPHKFLITSIAEGKVSVKLPFIRRNKNHINSLHACALATLCEYATGLCITTSLAENEYRIILKSIHMDYFFQGKNDAYLNFEIDKQITDAEILLPLKTSESVTLKLSPMIFDAKANHLCTGIIEWQVKKWSSVKTKV